MSTLASPASQGGTEVYILPLTEVSLPVAQQPGRSVQLLKSSDLGRHNLLYLKEIGHGWFGKVLLGEVNAGLSTSQVVVKELKASASVQDQMHFLEEAQPYRALQHPALLQCLAQCSEVTPYLLVMEFCPLGDVKGYLRSCRATDTMTPEPLILQRMACDVASGLLHLHKHNFVHGDLALRNCLLAADITVKIGDYGLSHNKYKDDYYVTSDQIYVPLRWMAPELIDEVHGNLLVADQTQQSNIWSLGVTIWELFELGNQPYRHYSDRQVLTYALREQQLRLPKPLLKVPLAERWYEVMQFCWLPPDQRPNSEEVHLLLSYLCAKSASEAEEDFERRWNSLLPAAGHSGLHRPSSSSSYPLLESFSTGDGYQGESGDDILTVMETSHGLNFEYKWEQARAEQPFHAASSGTLGQGNPHCQDMYYPPGGMVGGCPMEGLSLGASPSYYEPKQLHPPGVVPVLSAHSPSVGSEYYIRIEEPVDCNIDLDYTMCSYSPDYQGSSGSFLTGSADSGECMACPSQTKGDSYWSADLHKAGAYDSDASPAISLTMEPLLGHVSDSSPLRPWESGHYVSYKDRDGGYYYEHSPSLGLDQHYLMGRGSSEPLRESWGSRSLRQALGELEDPLGISPSVRTPPPQGYGDPYLESSAGGVIGNNVTGGYYDMMGSLRKTMPGQSHSVSINMETEGVTFTGRKDSDSEDEDEEDIFVERHNCNTWPSKRSGHGGGGGGGLGLPRRRASCRQDSYEDYHYTMPSTDIEDSWPDHHLAFHSAPKPLHYLEASTKDAVCPGLGKHHPLVPATDCSAYIYLCHEGEGEVAPPGECCHSHFVDPLTGLVVRNYSRDDYAAGKIVEIPSGDDGMNLPPAPGGPIVSIPALTKTETPPLDLTEKYVDITGDGTSDTERKEDVIKGERLVKDLKEPELEETTAVLVAPTSPVSVPVPLATAEPDWELSQTMDSGVDGSSVSLVDILDCSDVDDEDDDDDDDDITDVTSGIFVDEAGDLNASPAFKSLQKQVGTPDSMDSMDLPSGAGSCEGFSPAFSHPSSSPKAADSGYDTENNESPEFVPKEPHEPRDVLTKSALDVSVQEEPEEAEEGEVDGEVPRDNEPSLEEDVATTASLTSDQELAPLNDKNPYRDSAYFSDYENEKLSRDEGDGLLTNEEEEENIGEEKRIENKRVEKEEQMEEEKDIIALLEENEEIEKKSMSPDRAELTDSDSTIPYSAPVLSYLSSQPPENEECMMEEVVQDEGLGLGLELPREEGGSECSISMGEAGLEEWPAQEESSSLGDWAAEVVGAMEEALGALSGDRCTTINSSQEQEEEETEEEEEGGRARTEDSNEALVSPEVLEKEVRSVTSLSEEPSNSSETLPGEETNKLATHGTPSASSPPPPPRPPAVVGAVRPTADGGEEADEEDGDTDDSEESDEELRIYSVQEPSGGEESEEEEHHPVPIVVSDCSDAHNLRSLLKMPAPLADALFDDLERPRKVVSFFDDVTVYLFDQESPTKELVEHGFPLTGGSSGPASQGSSAHQERVSHTSDDSSDGNISEESAGYEWEDDFPLLPLPTSKMAGSDSPMLTRSLPPAKAAEPKAAAPYSRFTVSPSSVSRFSITHVSDSDVDSA